MSTNTPPQLRFDLSELRKFRHRLSGRVQVLYGDEIVADETVKLDDVANRTDFLQRVVGTLLLSFPDDKFANVATLDNKLINLVRDAEQDAQDGADTDGLAEERFAIDDQGRIVVQLFLADQPFGAPIVLTNFAARITSDTQHDDGAEVRRLYEIEVVIEGRRAVISVAAEHFADLSWLGRVGGAEAIVVAGPSKRDKAREAIQRLSLGKVAHRFTYGHLGWRVIRGDHVYLHAGGAIGPRGSLDDVDIHVPDALLRYTLPDPTPDSRDALCSLFRTLDILPDTVVLPLVAVIVAAVLDGLLGGVASVLVLGGTGMRKSSLVAALLHLAGGPWSAKTPPATWESTANALERLAHSCAQTALWVDDIRPAATRREYDNAANATQRLLREVVTRAGRQRLAPDITARPVYFPRGPVITTAEHLPRGASTLARLLVVPMEDIADNVLTELQRTAPANWPSVGASWVQYVAANYDALTEALPTVFKMYRADTAKRCPGTHLGLSDSAAAYLSGWRAFLQFVIATNALNEVEAEAWFKRLQDALDAAIKVTHRALDTERAESEYLSIVRELVELDQINIAQWPDAPPDSVAPNTGWYVASEGVIYLKAALIDREVRRHYRELGTGLPFPIEAARRGLDARGHLVRRGANEFTITMCEPGTGHKHRVLAIAAAALIEDPA